jgi:hypothetical protein
MKKIFRLFIFFTLISSGQLMGQSLSKNKIEGAWMMKSGNWVTYYKFNKDGTFLKTEVNKSVNRNVTNNGAYIFRSNCCAIDTYPSGNLMIFGNKHCCYRANFIADMLLMTPIVGFSSCGDKTLKRTEWNKIIWK